MNCRPNQVKKIIVLIAGAPDIGITKNCLSWFLNHGDIWKIVIRNIACNQAKLETFSGKLKYENNCSSHYLYVTSFSLVKIQQEAAEVDR